MIVFWLLIGRISGDNVEQKIFEEIFVGYNKEIRPVRLVMQIRDGRGCEQTAVFYGRGMKNKNSTQRSQYRGIPHLVLTCNYSNSFVIFFSKRGLGMKISDFSQFKI